MGDGELNLVSIDDMLASVDTDLSEFEKRLEEIKEREESNTLSKYLTDFGFTKASKGPASEKYKLTFYRFDHSQLDKHLRDGVSPTVLDDKYDFKGKLIENAVFVTSDATFFKKVKEQKLKSTAFCSSVVLLAKDRTIENYSFFQHKAHKIPGSERKVSVDPRGILRIAFPFHLNMGPDMARERGIQSLPIDLISSIVLMTQSKVVYTTHRFYHPQQQLASREMHIDPLEASNDYEIEESTTRDDPSADDVDNKIARCSITLNTYEFEIELDRFEGSQRRIEMLLDMLEKEGFEISKGTRALALRKVKDTKNGLSPMPTDIQKDKLFRAHMGTIEKTNKQHKLELLWHQKYSIAMAMRKKASILQADVGLGKTRVAIGMHYSLGVKRTLVCIEPGMIGEFMRETKKLKMDSPFVVRKSSQLKEAAEEATPITLIPYSILGTVLKNKGEEGKGKEKGLYSIRTAGDELRGVFDLVIFDECFPYDTELMTDEGPQSIGDIVTQRKNSLILSKNLETGEWQYKPVVHYFQKPYVNSLVKIEYNNGHSVICTPDHEVWTKEKGYVKAKELRDETVCFLWQGIRILQTKVRTPDDVLQYEMLGAQQAQDQDKSLRVVWEDLRPWSWKDEEEQEDTVLRKAVFCKVAEQPTRSEEMVSRNTEEVQGEGVRGSAQNGIQSTVRTHEKDEQRPRIQEESDRGNEEKMEEKPNVPIERRKRKAYCSAAHGTQGDRLSNGIHDLNERSQEETPKPSPTKEIRSRSCNPKQEGSDRDRRRVPQDKEVEILGQKEGIRIGYARVASVTILERGSAERLGVGNQEDQRVFNIDVGDNHNYIANGLLVKNCQNVKSPTSAKAKSAIRLKPRRSLFMSGTVVTNKMSELCTYALIGYGDRSAVSKLDTTPLEGARKRNKRYLVRNGAGYKVVHNISMRNMRISAMSEKMASDPEFTRDYVNNLVIKVSRENEDLVKSDAFRFNVKEMKVIAVPDSNQFRQYLAVLEGSRQHTDTEQRSLSKLMQMMKISECPELFDPNWKGMMTEKLRSTRELIMDKIEEERSVLVFTGFTQAAKNIHEMMERESIESFLLTSEQSPGARFKTIEKFRSSPCSVAVGNIGVLGKGFNLENADVVVMSDIPWSPAMYEQAVGRILRPDQEGNPEVYVVFNQFMIDQYKFEVISSKRRTIEKYLKDKDVSVDQTKHISYRDFLNLVIKKADERGS